MDKAKQRSNETLYDSGYKAGINALHPAALKFLDNILLKQYRKIEQLEAENAELRANWADLKEWIIETDGFGESFVLDKMKELEK